LEGALESVRRNIIGLEVGYAEIDARSCREKATTLIGYLLPLAFVSLVYVAPVAW